MRFFTVIMLFIASATLLGCTSPNVYLKKGKEIAPLVAPPGVPAIKQDPYYPIPESTPVTNPQPVSLMPPTLQKK